VVHPIASGSCGQTTTEAQEQARTTAERVHVRTTFYGFRTCTNIAYLLRCSGTLYSTFYGFCTCTLQAEDQAQTTARAE
jgi:hypothetical protein